jgi:hypothetical protein
MKRMIHKFSESEVLKQYPIGGRLEGWYFRLSETSNNAFLAEGEDLWGRKVSCQGNNEVTLLQECIGMAKTLGSVGVA